MNENLDLSLILKDCPMGTKLYCTFLGDVTFYRVVGSMIDVKYNLAINTFYSDGTYMREGECVLFPSKEQRDWSKFKVPIKKFNPEEFKPFDKVLVRDRSLYAWKPSFFENILTKPSGKCYAVDISYSCIWMMCIPYNEETKHLCGTTDDCPDYYKWWEE